MDPWPVSAMAPSPQQPGVHQGSGPTREFREHASPRTRAASNAQDPCRPRSQQGSEAVLSAGSGHRTRTVRLLVTLVFSDAGVFTQ